MALADLVRTAREARGWSKSKVARRAGVDRGQVSRIEAGERTGSLDTVVAVAVALDIDLNALKGNHPDAADLPESPAIPGVVDEQGLDVVEGVAVTDRKWIDLANLSSDSSAA